MEIIYVTVIGLGIAAVLRYLIPGRNTYGMLLLPAIGAAATAVIWVALTWAGWKADGTWIWVAALVGGAVISLVALLAIRSGRTRRDARLLTELAGSRA